ncbi:MAG: hydantoinase/oxoprolinase family protein [Betaproteobacteria bacterium]
MIIVAVDTGGTFTDLAAYDILKGEVKYTKSLTTYDGLEKGVFQCVEKIDIDLQNSKTFKHGTTLVINSLLQRVGSKVALLTTQGFRDILETGRGNRPEPFDLYYRRDPILVSRDLRFEVSERMSGQGQVVKSPKMKDIELIAKKLNQLKIDSIGISFLNSYLNDIHEKQVKQWLRQWIPDAFITCGTELTREWYEFERTATVAANAFVGPQVAGYVQRIDQELRLKGFNGQFFLMGSSGGVLALDKTKQSPISLVESGPVGGCIGTAVYANEMGISNAIAFDMGGTTAKCALVNEGDFDIKSTYYVGGYSRGFPIRGAVIDIVEVGAGGGSIAWMDSHQRLFVGPKSAGSTPGPVAYDRGGKEPTVTDANVILGRVNAKSFLGGTMQLNAQLAQEAIAHSLAKPLGYDGPDGSQKMAEGIIQIASVTMAGAIKRITLEKGLDPREYALFAFGGGGPLHAFEIAKQLHIPLVIIPPEPGNFSALGMLLSRLRLDESTTFLRPLDDKTVLEFEAIFKRMQESMHTEMQKSAPDTQPTFERFAEIRYRGQVHSMRTPLQNSLKPQEIRSLFEKIYKARYGHADSKNPIEIVNLSMVAHGTMDQPDLKALAPNKNAKNPPTAQLRQVYFGNDLGFVQTQVFQREELPTGFTCNGPALIEEYGSTSVVGPQDCFAIGKLGEIHIHINQPMSDSLRKKYHV